MAKYEVKVPETRTWKVVVDANDDNEAADKALELVQAGDYHPRPALPINYGATEVSPYIEPNIDEEETDHSELT